MASYATLENKFSTSDFDFEKCRLLNSAEPRRLTRTIKLKLKTFVSENAHVTFLTKEEINLNNKIQKKHICAKKKS